jgi:hypothetical protein
VSACERTSVEYKHAGEPGKCAKESERVCRLIPTNIRVHRFAESVSVNKFVNFGCARSLQRVATAYGRTDRQVRRGPTVAVGYIVKPPEPIYPTSTVLFYARQMPKKKATSKRKAKQRDEEETLEAAPAESPAPSARRSTRSTIHLDDDGPSVTPRSKQVELVESDKTDSAHPFAEKINWYAVCADERKGVVIEASAFRCSPPRKQPKPSPASPSAYMHVLALSVQATTSLCLSSPSPLQVRVRGAWRPASEAAATVAAATTTTAAAEVRMCRGGGGCCACARAADGGGDRGRRCRRRDSSSSSSSVGSGQWSVCVRSRRARDARVTRE